MDWHLRDLLLDQTVKVVDMKRVADLQTSTAKAVIGECAPEQVASRPEDDETLIDLSPSATVLSVRRSG
jgi:hypothetical protein